MYVSRKPLPSSPSRVAFESGLDSLIVAVDSLDHVVASGSRAQISSSFRIARRRYKRVEGVIELLAPGVAGVLNGPLPDDDGDAPPRPLGAPAAFQRTKTAIDFGATPDTVILRREIRMMRTALTTLRNETRYVAVGEEQVLDAARLEIARASTLGIAGVDVSDPGEALPEAADALEGLRSVAAAAASTRGSVSRVAWIAIDTSLRDAAEQLRHAQFEGLDRLNFIVRFAASTSQAVAHARAMTPHRPPLRRAWRNTSGSPFDSGAFDPSAYAPEYAPVATPALVALGRRLFFDPQLSGPRTRSCASCHNPDRGFADGRSRAMTLAAADQGAARNTPTLLNAALQPLLFADERAGSLEEQVAVVLSSPSEMQSSAQLAATRLQSDTSYRWEFIRAVPGRRDSAVTALSVRVALAAYVRSLTGLNSRFDRAVRGDTTALTPHERKGFTLFMGKARCGTCHFAPLFNGTMPPNFTTSEPEIIGVPGKLGAYDGTIDADPGRGGADHVETHRFAFRVPTLRNVAITAPYMHNGAFATLEQVVEFYDRGGGAGLAKPHAALTLSTQPLRLSLTERGALVAFLRSLTDTLIAPPHEQRSSLRPR